MNDTTTTEPVVTQPPSPRDRLRDRLFGFRSVLAVGVAGVVLGGAVGTAVTLVADDGHRPGPGPGGHGAPMGFPGGPGERPGPPGAVPPAPDGSSGG